MSYCFVPESEWNNSAISAAQGGYSGFQVTGMIKWSQKSRPKKIPRASSKTQKNPWTKNWPPKNPMPILLPLKVPERGNATTQRKALEIEHSCLFIHHTIWIYPFPHLILLNTPKNPYSNQATQAKFLYPKISWNRKFQTQKNPSIIPVTWNPEYPPWDLQDHGLFCNHGILLFHVLWIGPCPIFMSSVAILSSLSSLMLLFQGHVNRVSSY